MRILTINCGSSSLKFDLLDVEGDEITRIAKGSVERIGAHEGSSVLAAGSRRVKQKKTLADHNEAFAEMVQLLARSDLLDDIQGVGHRVVHGGKRLSRPVLIDDAVIDQIEAVSDLAPLHNHPALAAIEAARRQMRAVPMVATFDTAFYAELPEVAAQYALPCELRERFGIRRFGFHGLAHRYMVERFQALRPELPEPRVISLQLGNGCSVTASVAGWPLDTSMGFTPLEGLIMGSRSGDLDPSLPLFLARQEGYSLSGIEAMLNEMSGLLGLSGRSNDMRDLLAAEATGDEKSGLAVEAFCYRATKYIGAYLAVLGGADAVIFGGGIGEHSAEVRGRICTGLEWAGLTLDADANSRELGECRISEDGSGIEAWVVPVDEASVIAYDTATVLAEDG